MELNNIKKEKLFKLLINKKKFTLNNKKKELIKNILLQRIFPIYIKKVYTDIILNKKVKKLNIKWQIPNGLYFNKIKYNKDIILETKKYFRNKLKKKKNQMHIESLFLIKNEKIKQYFLKIIKELYYNLYNNLDKTFIVKNILNKSQISMLYYKHNKNNKFKGLKHHINSSLEHKGCITVITFNKSILDFIPFKEYKDRQSFRVLLPKLFAVTFDGDLRHCYTHGVPKDIEFKNNERLALNIRHPYIKNDSDNCDKNIKIKNWICKANINKKSIKYI
jgi:hypothetical protein